MTERTICLGDLCKLKNNSETDEYLVLNTLHPIAKESDSFLHKKNTPVLVVEILMPQEIDFNEYDDDSNIITVMFPNGKLKDFFEWELELL